MHWTMGPSPFFEERHMKLAGRLEDWRAPEVDEDSPDLEAACRTLAGDLADGELIRDGCDDGFQPRAVLS